MQALCLMLSKAYYAKNYAGIIGRGMSILFLFSPIFLSGKFFFAYYYAQDFARNFNNYFVQSYAI